MHQSIYKNAKMPKTLLSVPIIFDFLQKKRGRYLYLPLNVNYKYRIAPNLIYF